MVFAGAARCGWTLSGRNSRGCVSGANVDRSGVSACTAGETGKTIILFATSGGSGLSRCAADLMASAPGAVFREGKLLNGRQMKESLAAWVQGLGL